MRVPSWAVGDAGLGLPPEGRTWSLGEDGVSETSAVVEVAAVLR